MNFNFSSTIPTNYRKSLEELFFFNTEQHLFHSEIKETIRLFGAPKIWQSVHGLTIRLKNYPEAQSLFCLDQDTDELLAATNYFRSDPSELEIFHIAVNKKKLTPEFSLAVFVACVRTLTGVANQIKGVNQLILPYGRGRIRI